MSEYKVVTPLFTTFIKAKSINELRHKLIYQYPFPHNGEYKVYSSTGKYVGTYTRGMNDPLWYTPKGTLYLLFRDGSFREKYE